MFFVVFWLSCKNENENLLRIKNINFSPCKNNVKSNVESNNQQADDEKLIKFIAVSNKSLRVEQKMITNCCLEKFEVQLHTIRNDSIFIDEYTYGESCNCLCPIEICFDVEDLIENTTYVFVIKKNDLDYFTRQVEFTSSTNESFIID